MPDSESSSASRPSADAPQVVLVHGAWHGAWCWDAVRDALVAHGIPVAVVELPLLGLAGDAAVVRDALEGAADGAVVVGHSYGGLVISEAARDAARVSHLVYLAAFMLERGEDPVALLHAHGATLQSALRFVDGAVVVDPDAAAELFYADSTPEAAAAAIARLRPMHAGAFGAADAEPAWRSVTSTYVVCTADRALPPTLQREMARRAGAVRELDTDHSPFLTRPADVAALVAACRPADPA